ncbi:receptor-like protein kinase [Cryptomeria japonica]|uniref:receptor-like protein kinase n=1 Tax=Cryptomeria japonica TaxID=3369 RepID=UPI0027D9D700|nr:receptor-like protein kinase [Cryptomeria japonica]
MGLTGTVPPCLGKLSSLTELDLSFNRLSGNIPVFSSLAVLYLKANILEGETVLSTICMVRNLSKVDLSGNQLNGSLPSCLGSLSSLTELRLSHNRLSENIPLSFANMSSSLAVFDLEYNVLEGETVINSICMLNNLRKVDLSASRLNGNVPACLGRLSSLTKLDLPGNGLRGNIPLSFGNMSSSLVVLD